jgi:hypothetical protein
MPYGARAALALVGGMLLVWGVIVAFQYAIGSHPESSTYAQAIAAATIGGGVVAAAIVRP